MNEKIYFARYVRRCPAEHWLRKHQTVDKGTGRSKQGAVSTSDFQEICSIGIGQLLILLQHWRGKVCRPDFMLNIYDWVKRPQQMNWQINFCPSFSLLYMQPFTVVVQPLHL